MPIKVLDYNGWLPMDTAPRIPRQINIPDFSGVYGIREDSGVPTLLRPAAIREGHRRLSEKEMLKLARLTAMRIWK